MAIQARTNGDKSSTVKPGEKTEEKKKRNTNGPLDALGFLTRVRKIRAKVGITEKALLERVTADERELALSLQSQIDAHGKAVKPAEQKP